MAAMWRAAGQEHSQDSLIHAVSDKIIFVVFVIAAAVVKL